MSSFFYNNKFILQFVFWIFPLAVLPNECLAELNDLINYEDIYGNEQTIKPASNESDNEVDESTDISKELSRSENLSYPLFLGLCCGKCGGNMPLNIFGAGTPEPHEFRIKMNLNWGKMVGMRRGTSNRSTKDTLGQYMMTPRKMDMYMSSVSVGYAFSDRFFVGIMGMYMEKDMEMIRRGGRRSSMNSQGIGDTMLMTKTLLYADDYLIPASQVSLLLGVSIPTGSINQDDKGQILPYSMQLGSGTFDPFIGVLYEGSSSPLWWGANASYLARAYENYKSYNLGDEYRLDLYGMYQVRHNLVGELQIKGKYAGDIEGEAREIEQDGDGHMKMMGVPTAAFMSNLYDPDNYGGSTIDLTTGVQWQPFHNHILNAQFTVPLFQNLHGTQLERDFTASVTYYIEVPLRKSRRSKKSGRGLDILGF
ncbi:MAG: transporter [Candidatus Scalindua rubra]|uniref:Transporter n=1 Tax=Candidatus Scalindua brodae TaxID=237368 RepID=A0A0B0EDE3_9BACT|nr:MAG: hypothetical protein SCABRO_02932 [Candidatus Scalindua brodae]MBZ0110127.1 transporter [Candidatus Scalindua rubra]TWU37001.1 hypothetical protein S225a_04980 [Candidatus Brocadiaceae bacterium S225]